MHIKKWMWLCLISLLPLCLLYPNIINFSDFPLAPAAWEFIDPAVSQSVMVPGHRALLHAIYHDGGLLWSNLRAFGLPLLGNELQAAPLFPLTWLFLLIPEPYYWTVLLMFRLFLSALGTLLFANQLMGWSRLPSFVFVLAYAYGTATLSYLNHPHMNAMVSGIWYLYFSCLWLKNNGARSMINSAGVGSGIILSVYSLVTCGFPEAALLVGILSGIVILGFLLSQKAYSRLPSLVLWHFIGFALSSFQIFSVLEFLSLTPQTYRANVGLTQFNSAEFLWAMVARIETVPPDFVVRHHFGVVVLGLSLIGFFNLIYKRKFTWQSITALFAIVFILLKVFPVFPLFNVFVSSFPIADKTRFTVYGFMFFLWAVAFFAAEGAEWLLKKKEDKFSDLCIWLAGMTLSLSILAIAAFKSQNLSGRHFAQVLSQAFLLGVIGYLSFLSNFLEKKRALLVILLGILVMVEATHQNSHHFLKMNDANVEAQFQFKTPLAIAALLDAENLVRHNLREKNGSGTLGAIGVATIDNGAPPIQTRRLVNLRNTLFRLFIPAEDAASPIEEEKREDAFPMVGTSIFQVPKGTLHNHISWEKIGSLKDTDVYLDNRSLGRAYLAGKCTAVNTESLAMIALKNAETIKLGDVVLETSQDKEKVFCEKHTNSLQRLQLFSDFGTSLEVERFRGPAILVLNDNFYPGWSAKDLNTGEPFGILPANLGFRGMILPENKEYRVGFFYRPSWLGLAQVLTLGGGLIWILIWLKAFCSVKVK